MEIRTMAPMKTIKQMEKECINGRMAKCTTVNGCKASNMDMVSGRVAMEKVTSVSGSNQRLRGMACTCLQMGTSMRASGTPV